MSDDASTPPPSTDAPAPVTDDAATKTTPDGPAAEVQSSTDGGVAPPMTTAAAEPSDATTKMKDDSQPTPTEPPKESPPTKVEEQAAETPKEPQTTPEAPLETPKEAPTTKVEEPAAPLETPKESPPARVSSDEPPSETPGTKEETSTPEPPTHESDEPSSEEAPAPTEETRPTPVRAARLTPRKVPVNSFKDVRPLLQKTLTQLKHPIVKKMEKQTGLNREKLFYCAVAFVVFYLLCCPGNVFLSNVIVKAYPLIESVKCVRLRSRNDDTQWLAFWCAYGIFAVIDHFVAPFELLFALYLLAKTTALLYLGLPQTFGAHNLYTIYVNPLFCHEKSTKNSQASMSSSQAQNSKKTKKK